MKKRIIGIDVARGLAVIGMIIVNFKIVVGSHGDGWVKSFAQIFDGKAAATFVVLAGVGLALMTNSTAKNPNDPKRKMVRKKIIARALFLFLVGLSYTWIWPADILHFYGIYMLLTLVLIYRSSRQILIASTLMILLYPLLILILDYETGWNFATLTYTDLWTPIGFLRNLFYNGFHPVIPWTAFILFGVWFGRQDLYDDSFIKKSLWISSATFIGIQVFSSASLYFFSAGNPDTLASIEPLLGTAPMPPLPIYMANGIAISVATISACILQARRYPESKIISVLHKTGQLALTFYVAHVIIGMGFLEEISSQQLGSYTIEFSVMYALAFSACCMVFAVVWLRYFKMGPLEWLMRKVTDVP